MKQLVRIAVVAALLYLQSCGEGMIRNKEVALVAGLPASALIDVPVPKATANVIIKNEKDLTGYWVGWFEADTVVTSYNEAKTTVDEFYKKINLSIDEINGSQVKGHCVVTGELWPFRGTVEKKGNKFLFEIKKAEGDKYDGAFKFSISVGQGKITGTWIAKNNIKLRRRKYDLTKKFFEYDATLTDKGGIYMHQGKESGGSVGEGGYSNFEDDTDPKFFTSSRGADDYNASVTLLTKEQVANLTKGDLILLRSYIYARHGYSFKRPDFREYFEQLKWYLPISPYLVGDLTDIEIKNIELLTRYEKNSKAYYNEFSR